MVSNEFETSSRSDDKVDFSLSTLKIWRNKFPSNRFIVVSYYSKIHWPKKINSNRGIWQYCKDKANCKSLTWPLFSWQRRAHPGFLAIASWTSVGQKTVLARSVGWHLRCPFAVSRFLAHVSCSLRPTRSSNRLTTTYPKLKANLDSYIVPGSILLFLRIVHN